MWWRYTGEESDSVGVDCPMRNTPTSIYLFRFNIMISISYINLIEYLTLCRIVTLFHLTLSLERYPLLFLQWGFPLGISIIFYYIKHRCGFKKKVISNKDWLKMNVSNLKSFVNSFYGLRPRFTDKALYILERGSSFWRAQNDGVIESNLWPFQMLSGKFIIKFWTTAFHADDHYTLNTIEIQTYNQPVL